MNETSKVNTFSRESLEIGGLWEFTYLGDIDLDTVKPEAEYEWELMYVPSAFDATPGYIGKRGAALYRVFIDVPVGHCAKITFGAVSMWCRVFIDGVRGKEHACGYAPFDVIVPSSRKSKRELIVLVDNRYDFERVPMHEEYFDFYQYGGIIRPVHLTFLPEDGVWIDRIQTLMGEDCMDGKFTAKVFLRGISGEVCLQTQVDQNPPVQHEGVCIENGTATVQLAVPNAVLWSPESPELHSLSVKLPNGDARDVRFGLRYIKAHSGSIWLNGEKVILKGYNRHEWHPTGGPATSPLEMYNDVCILKKMGCNFVRGSHYPQDQRFLDLCDEIGLLVWEENLGWGQREKTFSSEKWKVDHRQSLQAMVCASANHPSVIMWGFLNEAGTDEDYVRPVFEESVAILREMDPTRLVTYATMFAQTDKCYDLVDVVSLNIYPGWYNCEGVENPVEMIVPYMVECFKHVDQEGFGDKPIIISEIGAEGLYGWRDLHNDFFSEAYQAEYLRHACQAALDNARCSGIALWHFSDVRTYGGGWSLKRPRTFNNKGTLDEYRRPKEAYNVVRECFQKA